MNFLSSIVNKLTSSNSNYVVTEMNRSTVSQYEILFTDDHLKLYKVPVGVNFRYCAVLTVHGAVPKFLRLFALTDEPEAIELYSLFSSRVVPIVSICRSIASTTSKLQDLCSKVRQSPNDSVTHHCVKMGLSSVLKTKHPQIARNVNSLDDDNRSPLHLACVSPNVSDDIVQELMCLGADAGLRDSHGETAIHFAAKYSPSKLQLLLSQPTEGVNCMSIYGETPLHIACLENQASCADLLVQYGADPSLSESYKLPIHCAVKANNTECVKILVEKFPELLSIPDGKFGGTALHWAKNKEMITCLLDNGAPVDALSNTGDTALHIMLKEDRKECVNALLIGGADVTIPNHEGETALHIAIPTDDLAMVRSLVVFGADVNRVDRNGNSPRHMAATQRSKNSASILYTLHMIGAGRCLSGRRGCTDGCASDGKYEGSKVSEISQERIKVDSAFDDLMNMADVSGIPPEGHRVLCLDGGGIRGILLCMMLIQLEKLSGVDIRDNFDWISGTSTGGILALALTHGKNARYCLGLYFKLKNKVFCGSKPYCADILENLLKEVFGDDTMMSEMYHPRVLVTAVLADRFPPDLHLFRNYENPLFEFVPKEQNDRYPPPPTPNETFVWQAARSSGAAPTFFTASLNRFLDGGLMSNNPTMDTLTEIQEYNTGLRLLGRHQEIKPVKCVVSLGTGRPPQTPVTDIDVYIPSGIFDAYKVVQGANSLRKMLVEQATQSEGRPNERARAWCAMVNAPFFRLSPQLSVLVNLDETDDDTLLLVCWETMVYLHSHQEKLIKIANILNQGNWSERACPSAPPE